MVDNYLSRRRIIRALGAGGAVSIAGCSGGDEQGTATTSKPESDGTETPTPGKAQLQKNATVALKTDATRVPGPCTEV